LFRTEGVLYLGEEVEGWLVWVLWGGLRGGEIKIEKIEFCRVVDE
jgi:hypothetical protein